MKTARQAELSAIWRALPADDERAIAAMDELARRKLAERQAKAT